jgi:hypothetical protein
MRYNNISIFSILVSGFSVSAPEKGPELTAKGKEGKKPRTAFATGRAGSRGGLLGA